MTFWTLDRVSAALAGRLTGTRPAGRTPLGRVSTDTRSLEPGDAFVALRGERWDGHTFLAAGVAAGARALVVGDPAAVPAGSPPVFVVDDTTAALGALGGYRRRAWGGTVVAVAGSNGKTTTRSLIAAGLGARLDVHASAGNLNNAIGVPLTLLAVPDLATVAVVEIGTNHPGEVAPLRDMARPDIAVVTSIGEEHLEGFGSLAGVLREESSVFDGVAIAVTPADAPDVAREAAGRARTVVDAGLDGGRVRPSEWGLHGDGRGWFVLDGTRVEVPLAGAHNVRNAILAMAVTRACGVADEDAARGIAALRPVPMRSALETIGSLLVLNDAYNANPSSARAALDLADAIAVGRQRVVILGSMLELGPQGPSLHDEILRRALGGSGGIVVLLGEFAGAFARLGTADARVIAAPDVAEAWASLAQRLATDAFILLKGSRGARLERFLPLLREFAGAPAAEPGGQVH